MIKEAKMNNPVPYAVIVTWNEDRQQYCARSGAIKAYHRSFETARAELIKQLEGLHGQDKKG